LLLYQPAIPGIDTVWLGTVALWVAAILTLWSMFHYLRLAAPDLNSVESPAQSAESADASASSGERKHNRLQRQSHPADGD
ncbi:MAG TPA: hypothetical protein VEN29_14135, partial [Casimicrobiaceae bacterium]|nr:hypothetical protein [Casimicrobiaceae bacterium]